MNKNTRIHIDVATASFRSGDLEEAERQCRDILETEPEHPLATLLLGVVLLGRREWSEARDYLKKATSLDPLNIKGWYNLGLCEEALGHDENAHAAYEKARELDENHFPTLVNFGLLLHRRRERDAAVSLYRHLALLKPDTAEVHVMLAKALRQNRDAVGAIRANERANELDPNNPSTLARLASLYEETHDTAKARQFAKKVLTLKPNHVGANITIARCDRLEGNLIESHERLTKLPVADASSIEKRDLAHELAVISDDLENYDDAFRRTMECSQISLDLLGDRVQMADVFRGNIESLITHYQNAQKNATNCSQEFDDGFDDPVFLVGFPRSGTSLLGQILNTHSQLMTLQEQPYIDRLISTIQQEGKKYPAEVDHLGSSEIRRLRALYFDFAEADNGGPISNRLVDKNPFNFVNSDLISRVFPKSHIIFVVRHPLDVALSCLMQNFRHNEATANFYTLDRIAATYDRTMTLWRLFQNLLSPKIRYVQYESVVQSFDNEIESLLQAIGMEREDELVNFAERTRDDDRKVLTPSYNQITQGIYANSAGRWENYAKYLEPIAEVMTPWIEHWEYPLPKARSL